jgi:DNA-directed RNA polymerase subunit K/omega
LAGDPVVTCSRARLLLLGTSKNHHPVPLFTIFFERPAIMDLSLPQRLQRSVNGSFHKTALLQRRVRELVRGSAPLLETRKVNPIEIAFLEMERGLIELVPDEDALRPTPTMLIPEFRASEGVREIVPSKTEDSRS